MSEFPKWGFWIGGIIGNEINQSKIRHLFVSEKETVCGHNPRKRYPLSYYRFSASPRIPEKDERMWLIQEGRLITAEDFPKCKRCLKLEGKKK
jgi:hypothetical protein